MQMSLHPMKSIRVLSLIFNIISEPKKSTQILLKYQREQYRFTDHTEYTMSKAVAIHIR